MCLLHPQAEGGLGPSLLYLWASLAPWFLLAGLLGVPTFDWTGQEEEGGLAAAQVPPEDENSPL